MHVRFSLPQTFLRTCVFQHPENGGVLERLLARIYNLFSRCICSSGYDRQRAKQGLDSLARLGATFDFVTLSSGERVHMMVLHPQDLMQRLSNLGAQWQKRVLSSGEHVLAIVPPVVKSKEWEQMRLDLLRFKWPEKEGLIITCPCANFTDSSPHCFLHANSASESFVMLKERMGVYLGTQSTICFFDPPGSGESRGIAFEGAYYEAIKRVYERVNPLACIWVSGACLGNASATYLKTQFPSINLILENSFTSKDDILNHESRFVKWFARRYWNSTKKGDAEECDFGIVSMLERMPTSHIGKTIIINVDNDQRLDPAVATTLAACAARVSATVSHLHYTSQKKKDPHFDRFYHNARVYSQVISDVFA